MKIKRDLVQIFLLGVMLLPVSVRAQFQWAERIASATTWPGGGKPGKLGEPNVGLALDTNDNCYVTGWFDDTNNFGGVTLTNQSAAGGSDIFVAKYNSTGALQWVRQAGDTIGGPNNGRGIGLDANGNIYVEGGYYGTASFGSFNLPSPSSGNEGLFLAKYNNAGAIQWVQNALGVNGNLYGIGLTVDSAGNSYALAYDDDDNGATVTFGSVNISIPEDYGESTILVKYDSTGAAQWAMLMGGGGEVYATKVAVDASGNVYVRGLFEDTLTIGSSNLTLSAGSTEDMFLAKFNSSGSLVWVQQPQGTSNEGGVAVDQTGNVYTSGAFFGTLNFGDVSLTNMASDALFGDAFVAKYNSSGAIQWAQPAGGTNGGFYWDVALDAQTNVYPAGFLGSDAAIAKYNSAGILQWTESANGLPASPVASTVSKCAVDAAGNCYLAGWYQGTNTFGTNTLQPQEAWNFFLAEAAPSATVTNPTIQFTASPTNGAPPLNVQFNSPNVDSLGNAITSWNWNFGDGSTSTLQNPSHIYTTLGTFSPTLVATNNNGVAVIGTGPQITTLMFTSSTNFTYTTNNGAITITGYIGSDVAVNIPDTINGLPVTSIGSGAFANINSLTSVTIPDNVTNIGLAAFDTCDYLTNVTIGINVTSIGGWAFDQCENLASLIIPNSVTSIGESAFDSCSKLTSVTIPTSVAYIGPAAFSTCFELSMINVDPSNAVYSSVDGVVFDKSQTILVEYSSGKTETSYTIPDSVTSIGDDAFWNCYNLATINIPNSVTNIGNGAFGGCNGLTSVTIPDSVTGIEDDGFLNCLGLTNITISASVISIGNDVFAACLSLTAITVDAQNPSYSSLNGVLFDKSQITLIEYPGGITGSYTIPGSVTSIGQDAFDYSSLTSVTIPNNVTSIGYGAFDYSDLTNVTIAGNVTNIGDYAFFDCSSLIGAYFEGNAPYDDGTIFNYDNDATVYYLPGTSGWGSTFGSVPTALWFLPNPLILNNSPSFGLQANRFGFTISWATNISVVVEACTNLANPAWIPLSTNTLTAGTNYFSDPAWTNYPLRFYRISTTTQVTNSPAGMALIPAGSFTIGDTLDGESDANPTNVYVSAFYMDTNLVSYSQ